MFIDTVGNLTKHDSCLTLQLDDITVFDPSMSVLPEAGAWGNPKINIKGRPYRTTVRRFRWELSHVSADGKGTLVKVSECPPCDAVSLFDAPDTGLTATPATTPAPTTVAI